MADLSLYLKFAAIIILLFVATTVVSPGRISARTGAAAVFLVSLAGYLGCQLCHLLHHSAWLVWLIHIGCFGVPFAFYLFAESLFVDAFRFRLKHLLMFLFIETLNFVLVFSLRVYAEDSFARFGEPAALLRALPQIVSFTFILTTLFSVIARRKADLVEARRKFRMQFMVIAGAAILLILITELIYQQRKTPELFDLIRSGVVLILVWYFSGRLIDAEAGHGRDSGKNAQTPPPAGIDQALLARLNQAMHTEKIFMRESLSIRGLAEYLQTQEYILRRLINSALGYRNFNDYLNEFRIEEARRLLSDRANASLPILRLAMDLGFGSLAPFNRAFKVKTGMTPVEFRKTAAGLQ